MAARPVGCTVNRCLPCWRLHRIHVGGCIGYMLDVACSGRAPAAPIARPRGARTHTTLPAACMYCSVARGPGGARIAQPIPPTRTHGSVRLELVLAPALVAVPGQCGAAPGAAPVMGPTELINQRQSHTPGSLCRLRGGAHVGPTGAYGQATKRAGHMWWCTSTENTLTRARQSTQRRSPLSHVVS